MIISFLHRYSAAFSERGEQSAGYYNEYELCIVLKSTGDLGDWTEADCYEPKGYICKIKGKL